MSDRDRFYGSLLGMCLSLLVFIYAPTWLFVLLGLGVAALDCWWIARYLIIWIFQP